MKRRGDIYIGVLVAVIVLLMLLSLILHLIPLFQLRSKMDLLAQEVLRAAELSGDTQSTDVLRRIKQMKREVGIDPEIRWEANFVSGTRVQLGEPLTIVVTDRVALKVFIFEIPPIPVSVRATGQSEAYWK